MFHVLDTIPQNEWENCVSMEKEAENNSLPQFLVASIECSIKFRGILYKGEILSFQLKTKILWKSPWEKQNKFLKFCALKIWKHFPLIEFFWIFWPDRKKNILVFNFIFFMFQKWEQERENEEKCFS